MKLRYILLVLLTTVFIASCGKDNPSSPDPPDPPEEEVASEEIGSDGGEITSPDGNLTLTFPEGALSGTETITIEELSEDDLGDEFNEIIDSLGFGGAYELGPDGLQFDEPVTASIPTKQTSIENDTTLQLNLELMLTSSGGQVEVPDSLRIEPVGDGSGNMQVSGTLSHFSGVIKTEAILGAVTARIIGIPDQLAVGDTTGVGVQVTVGTVNIVPLPFHIGPFNEFTTPFVTEKRFAGGIPETDQEGVYELSGGGGRLPYTCIEEGEGKFQSKILIYFSTEQNSFFKPLSGESKSLWLSKESIKCVEPEEPEGDVLPTGLFESPEGLSNLEGAFRLYQQFLSSFKTASSHNSIQQLEERQFGLLSGKLPMAFSGETGFVVVDLLTGEVLLSGTSDSYPRGSPAFGVIGLTETPPGPDSPATIVLFGETGFGFYNTEFGGTQLSNQPTAFDAFPAGGNPESGYAVGIQEGVVFIGLDEENGDHDIREAGSFESAFDGEPISAWMPDAFDPTVTPALVLTRDDDPNNSLESGVYVETRNENPPVRAVDVGLDARKIRCAPDGLGAYLCAVSVFGDDELALLSWDGTSSEPSLTGTTGVGDGPVDLDVRYLPNDNIGVVSTGYNDDTVTITELGSDGSVISKNTKSVPEGCQGPAHAILLHDDASLKVVGTCTDSGNYFVMESEL